MNRLARALLPAALAVPLVLAGCSSETTELPSGLGPLAVIGDLAWPAECEGAGATGSGIALSSARPVIASPAYNEMKARACVPFPLADVWQALQIPSGVQVAFWPERDESDCAPTLNVEPGYAVSFATEEIPHGAIESHFTFVVTWRADVTAGTAQAPTEVKMLYGKTSGTTEVPWLRGSMVFTPDPVNPGWTRIELVRQLNTNGHSDDPTQLARWLTEFHEGLGTRLSTGTLQPTYCVLP
ncbi:MAG TPA: hypothetical protein PLL32_00160 [Anaeromyxobacteraceae bacterium]|nr:hypothetical protein [Anaeromyxobacteraceae bacterium]